jgi:hypothetical protein
VLSWHQWYEYVFALKSLSVRFSCFQLSGSGSARTAAAAHEMLALAAVQVQLEQALPAVGSRVNAKQNNDNEATELDRPAGNALPRGRLFSTMLGVGGGWPKPKGQPTRQPRALAALQGHELVLRSHPLDALSQAHSLDPVRYCLASQVTVY